MLLGVLDIGSNSAQLQVVEVRPGAPLNESLVLPLRPLDQVTGEDSSVLPWDEIREHPHVVKTP